MRPPQGFDVHEREIRKVQPHTVIKKHGSEIDQTAVIGFYPVGYERAPASRIP